MRQRLPLWFLALVVLIASGIWFWKSSETARNHTPLQISNAGSKATAPPPAQSTAALLSQPTRVDFTEALAKAHEKQNRSRFPNRLSNTTLPLKQLVARDSAILLQNALLDTAAGVWPKIPGHLQTSGDPGTYIVQAKGPPDEAFRAQLKQAGVTIVSYIPNNAYLVRSDASAASAMAHAPQIQAVLKYEPYYKLSPLLLDLAVKQRPLPENGVLKVLLFSDARDAALGQLRDLGASVLSEEASPFGPVVSIQPPVDALSAVAGLGGVQAVELARARASANDLSRFSMGVAADTQAQTNYLGLTGNGILVNVNDTGIDATHPDLPGVTGDSAISLVDSNGHGTHVAGIIASTGGKSDTVTNAKGSVMPPTNGQFRGKAPKAKLYSMTTNSDPYLQQQAARTNAFISNNSWNYGNAAYDLAAASYDAAVRDALPTQPGSHPLLFVFSAGNLGGAMNDWDDGSNDDGTGGSADTILSPATAKNVISVGALEQPRGVTNDVWKCVPNPSSTNGQSCQTNKEWMPSTDTDDQVASFSSRGNVGIGLEGPYGRFKPDVVAPGSAVVSTRSAQWNQRDYYNPTSHVGPPVLLDLELQTNALFIDSFFIPANAVAVTIDVVNRSPNVPVPIYVRQAAAPTTNTYDFVRANHVSIPPDAALSPVNAGWFYALGNPTNVPVFCDVFIDITVTNEHGNFLQVLSNMNNTIGPYYRYESGTSLAAAGVSGMLALMQEFFEQLVGVTNSPALMKALVINGARSIGSYNLQVQNSINFQGWGMVDLTNTIQGALRTQPPNAATAAKYYLDQNTNTALATGDSRTYNLRVNPDGQELPLRITLAWTDPPGNPIASMKLVNDLDLIVTNTDLPDPLQRDVFLGNDILSGNDFNLPWDTNTAPNIDYVNNVENIYLLPPLGSNYTITVHARRVNVNALTDHPNNTVQDFALVISSGDGETNSALTLNPAVSSVVMTNPPTVVTNDFVDSPTDFGQILYVQQSGANTPLLGTNTLTTLPLGRQGQELLFDGQVTVGMTNQWHFYIFTNSPDSTFTNVAFVVYNSATLSLPRMGTWEKDPANATTIYPDIDLYVSTDPGLLRLEAGAIVGADKSLSRGGDEAVIYTNAGPSQVYYIAVKSENQEAVEFTFFGDSSPLPFGSTDEQGNFHGYGHRLGAPIPDDNAKGVDILVLAFGRAMPKLIKRAVATNTVSHELMGDLLGTLNHFGTKDFVVLNNHAPDTPVVRRTFTYDDSGQVAGGRRSDGPGSLLDFQGKGATGIWRLKEVDNAFGHLGTNDQFGLFLENQPDLTDGVPFQLSAGACDYAFFAVPAQATNLQLSVSLTNGTGPLLITLCRFDAPLCASGCKSQIVYSNAVITLGLDDEPPINAGTYIVTFCNLGPDTLQGTLGPLKFELGQGLNSPRLNFTGGPVDIQDNAVTYSTIHVGNVGCMRTAEVGVRIDHPRVSDLMLHLIAPDGTRVLLNQNRGALTTNGMGYSVTSTNIIPVSSSGGPEATTNNIDTGTTSGTITISYQFFDIPDEMRVYYQGTLIWNSGLIRGTGTTNLTFGPGLSSLVNIVMNQGGNTNTTTRWEYTVTSTTADYFYLTFTENTNVTTSPMKFTSPPFQGSPGASNVLISGFEGATVGTYTATSSIEGWKVVSNSVMVIADPTVAQTGNQYLALLNGAIRTNIATQPNHKYKINFSYRLAPSLQGIVAWWKGEGNAIDIVGGHNGTAIGAGVSFPTARVGQGFHFDGTSYIWVPPSPALQFTNEFSIEFWYRTERTNTEEGFISTRNSEVAGFNYYLNIISGNFIQAVFDDPNIFGDSDIPGHRFEISRYVPAPPAGAFHYLAVTYRQSAVDTVEVKTYLDGALVKTRFFGARLSRTVGVISPFLMGTAAVYAGFELLRGTIDEPAIFNRALTAAEIQAIYAAGAAGKCGLAIPPAVCFSQAQVALNGTPISTFTGSTNWQTNTLAFTALGNSASVELAALGGNSGIYLDTFTITDAGGPEYVLPEESLDKIAGLDPFGDWKLEIADTRVGATNPTPTLVKWQLSLIMENTTPAAVSLVHHQPVTNTVSPGRIRYFLVDVPSWASFATNWLITASGPVDLMFNQVNPPTGTNVGDSILIPNSTGGIATLQTNGTPPLRPGLTYRLGVRNTGTLPVTFTLEVDFDVTPLTNGIPVSGVMTSNSVPRYFSYDVSSNEIVVLFQLTNMNGNADLVVRDGLPFPTLTSFDYKSANIGSNDENILVIANGEPVPLKPGRWYLGVFNADTNNVNYTIVVISLTNPGPSVVTLTNKSPFIRSAAPPGGTDYYRYVVSGDAARAQFELLNANPGVTLLARRGGPASLGSYDLVSYPGVETPLITLMNGAGPFTLQSGEWFLSAVNTSGSPANYTIMASDYPVSGTNITIYGQTLVKGAGTNGVTSFCLNWNSMDGLYYYIEAKMSLSDPVWTKATSRLTGADGQTTWCVPLPSQYHFFRVQQWLGAATAASVLQPPGPPNIRRLTNGIALNWSGASSSQFQVQWSPTLKPADWRTFSNTVSSTNGAFSFLDDGKQTGGLGGARYYRLVRVE